MLSKKQIKFISSLKLKKFREKHNLFIAEGVKIVEDFCRLRRPVSDKKSSIMVKQVFAIKELIQRISNCAPPPATGRSEDIEIIEVSEAELKKISAFTTPNRILCIAEIPDYSLDLELLKSQLTLVLDNVNDPGNLGTIIRIADWFGIQNIVCSENCVDVYNPKVVQATMGSIARVKVHYHNLVKFLKEVNINGTGFPVYGTVLNGKNIYQKKLCKNGLIILGNESEGISDELNSFITDKISIPSFSSLPVRQGEAESLNVAVATAIVCSEFKRKAPL